MADAGVPLAHRPQKRRRPALACEQCRTRKVRCDRLSPCGACVRSRNPECSYLPPPPLTIQNGRRGFTTPGALPPPFGSEPQVTPASNPTPPSPISSLSASATITPSLSSIPLSTATVESLERRVKQLEKELQATRSQKLSSETWPSPPKKDRPSSALHGQPDSSRIGKTFVPLPIRGTLSKTRFFGQSHWVNGSSMIHSKVRGY